jgi:transposase InsO family protein
VKADVTALLDCGADANFMNLKFAQDIAIPLTPITVRTVVRVADGKLIPVQFVTEPITMTIDNHVETISFLVLDLAHRCILGFSWLEKHDPHVHWSERTLSFTSSHCHANCLPSKAITDVVTEIDPSPPLEVIEVAVQPSVMPTPIISTPRTVESPFQVNTSVSSSDQIGIIPDAVAQEPYSVHAINAVALEHHLQEADNIIVEGFINFDAQGELNFVSLNDLTSQVYPFFADPEIAPTTQVPEELKDFLDVFDEKEFNQLPPHRPYDCEINLTPDIGLPPVGRPYNMTLEENEVLRDWLKENVDKGFIRRSSSPFGAPCFFVKKPAYKNDSKLRLCMDYRGLNKLTIKNRYPIPLISDIFRTLAGHKIYTTLDLPGAYNLLRIKEGHEFKTAFITKYGQYEFLVMPFGLANAPAHFQAMMNDIFRDYIGVFVVVYLDDIVVYSDSMDEHWTQVRAVLQVLRENQLYCRLEKCHFAQEQITYLGYILSQTGLSMDPLKVKAITEWPEPKNVNELQIFLGFANFYRRLIRGYATLTAPLTTMLQKGQSFTWTPELQIAFNVLKSQFTDSFVLSFPDEQRPFYLELDASDYGIGGILSQYDDKQVLRPVAFYSRQMVHAERNYDIYDKELLIIYICFKEWRHFLQGGRHPVVVLSDHKNLEHFMTTKQLTRRQARWALFLAEFDFAIEHVPGVKNQKADALSRRPDFVVTDKVQNQKRLFKNRNGKLILALDVIEELKTDVWGLYSADFDLSIDASSEWPELCEIDQVNDWPLIIAHFLNTNEWLPVPAEVLEKCKRELNNFTFKQDVFCRVLKDKRTTIPYLSHEQRPAQLKRFHDGLGHLRFDSIKDLIKQRFWWPAWSEDVRHYIAACPQCQLDQSINSTHAQPPVRPVPPVALPFLRWGVDFMQDLPETKSGNRNVITAIDYGSRVALGRALRDRTAEAVAEFLYDEILMNFGAPYEIITDRANSFLSDGIALFYRLQGIRHHASTPYHPQTNGMVERMHQMVNHALTTLTNGKPERWDEYLKQTLFALRVRTHAVTKHSPFYLMYGVHPRLPGDTAPLESAMQPLDELEEMEARGEYVARTFEELGNARRAAYERSKVQAEVMRKRHNLDPNAPEYFFKVGDWVKMKHHSHTKFEFDWKGPYHVVDVGFPGTYWLMEPSGRRLDSTINESDLAPWLALTEPNRSYFNDGTNRSFDTRGEAREEEIVLSVVTDGIVPEQFPEEATRPDSGESGVSQGRG